MKHSCKLISLLALLLLPQLAASDEATKLKGWYTQGDFEPVQRLEIVLHNALDRARLNSPVTIRRDQLSALPDVNELAITLVDPGLPGRPEPSNEQFQRQGGHEARKESNGAWIPYQLDDLDQDGLWDELFFMSDFAPGESKVFYLYIGDNQRGWLAHRTHAAIGTYVRHTVPFWESEEIGWKLWFNTDIDVFGKRSPVLMSQRLYMDNLDGYGVSTIDPAFGSDIMQVNNSFGGGGVGVFEDSQKPNVVSRPRFTPRSPAETNFNAGPVGDSRYAFTVLANGPVRSVIRATTFNWDSGNGQYELEQVYSAYAGQSYSTARVRFLQFAPENQNAVFAVGIRKHLDESSFYNGSGIVISGAPEAIRNQDDEGLRENSLMVDFVGTALVVPERYSPEYVFVPEFSENHAFRIKPNEDRTFEYLIAAGWSEGSVNQTADEFQKYVLRTAEEYNSPVELVDTKLETREISSQVLEMEESLYAFPGAEGYGKHTIGGRGGEVYEVTNLNDDGDGSLRAAVEASGPRTIVFRVSGTIKLNSDLKISNPNITIAGQTAPGDGIALRGYPLLIEADEVIVRYIRVRFGDESGDDSDAITSRYTNNLILDHVSASWSVDETMSIYHGENITVQWSLISESMYRSNHVKGDHGFGGIWGSNNSSYHHNLLAHHSSRNPRFASGSGNTDYRNNVVYNWGYKSTYGGEVRQVDSDKFTFTNINMVANYYKPGPATGPGEVSHQLANPWSRNGAADYGKWYVAHNVMEGNAGVTLDNWNGGVQAEGGESFLAGLKLEHPWPAMAIEQQTAEEAYASVLENAGASLPKRDAVDARIVDEVRNGYATYEGAAYKEQHTVADESKPTGIIDSQADVGGWPELKSAAAPTDSDHDGMPDEWESRYGLDPNDATDRNLLAADGYTMLEKYLNSID